MKETYQTENKVEYDLRSEKSEYNITIRKKKAPEMSQPVARESFQLFFYDRIFHLRVFWGGGGGGAYQVSTVVRHKFKELITYSKETTEIEITETKKKPSSCTDSAVVES